MTKVLLTKEGVSNQNQVLPRGLSEVEAAKYIGMSPSFLRKDRMYGVLPGRTAGPRWVKVGKRIIYLREDLDAWLEKNLVAR